MILRLLLLLLLLNSNSVYSLQQEGINVRFLQTMVDARPGQLVTLQVMISNKSARDYITLGRLNAPPDWKVTSNESLFSHLSANQSYMQTLTIQVAEDSPEGEFKIEYDVFNRQNLNIHDRDQAIIVVRHLPSPSYSQEEQFFTEPDQEEEPEPEEEFDFSNNSPFEEEYFENLPDEYLHVTSPRLSKNQQGNVLFVSVLLNNTLNIPTSSTVHITPPEAWTSITPQKETIELEPNSSLLKIFAIKIPDKAIADEYKLTVATEGDFNEKKEITLFIDEISEFSVTLLDEKKYYPLNDSFTFSVECKNKGNHPLFIDLNNEGDPKCAIHCEKTSFIIAPYSSEIIKITIDPEVRLGGNLKQVVFLSFRDTKKNKLICTQPYTFNMTPIMEDEDDPFIRIPSHFRVYGLGNNSDIVFAVEAAGEGLINPERNRYFEYFFRIPTKTENVIFNIEQRLYVGVSEPEWDISLGDTVYDLSPLTQNYRYGRGAGFNLHKSQWNAGAHYTQNTFNNDYNPKELCGYYEFVPNDWFSVAGNYLHKNLQEIPTSNIATVSSEFMPIKDNVTELEFGKNFVDNVGSYDTYAYRAATRGRYKRDTWYSCEKIYAGSAFFGYYQHTDSFNSTVDFPIRSRLRGNLSYTFLNQNFDETFNAYSKSKKFEEVDITAPRQRQWNATFTYSLSNSQTVSINGLVLKARDVGLTHQYHFLQKWGGFTYTLSHKGYTFNSNVAFGNQHDFEGHNTSDLLQRYYFYLSKQLSSKLSSSLFYEGGNTNYYDARPWRTSVGGSLRYEYGFGSWYEIFLQKVNNTPDQYNFSQISGIMNHTFKNFHSIQGTVQYFRYQTHYTNNFQFIVSYTIPFGLPVSKKNNSGSIRGYVYDSYYNRPVASTVVSVNGGQTTTNAQGYFNFLKVPPGEKNLKVDILPKDLITQQFSHPIIVERGKPTDINIPVTPSCHLSGKVLLYAYEEPSTFSSTHPRELVQKNEMQDISITIDRDNGKEIYNFITNSNGSFKFNDLRPGTWRISIDTSELPPLHEVKSNDLIVAIEPEEHKEVTFKIVPKIRVIQPLD